MRELDGGRECSSGRRDSVDEPDGLGLVRIDRAPRQDEVERVRQPDQTRESYGASVDQRDAPPAAEHAHRRVFGGDA